MISVRLKNAIFGILLVNWLNVIMHNIKYIIYSQFNVNPSEIFNSSNSIILISSSLIFGVYTFYLGILKLRTSNIFHVKNNKNIILPIIILFALFSPLVYAYVFQQESHSVGMMILDEALIDEDFDDVPPGEVPPGWESGDGNWTAVNDSGNMVFYQEDYSDKEALSISLTGNSSWSNYTFEVDLKFVGGNDNKNDRGALLIFRYQGGNDYYFLWMKEFQDEMELYNHGSEGGGGVIASTSISLVASTWYHVNITIIGQEAYVSVDDIMYFDGIDMDGPNDDGSVGVGTRYYQVMFDNIYVDHN